MRQSPSTQMLPSRTRAKMQERDTAAYEKAAERGERAYTPATSAQFTPEAAGETDDSESRGDGDKPAKRR